MIEPKVLKGFRDFPPQEAIARQYVIEVIRQTFESYGFDPIETPAIEYLETFAGNIGEDEKLFYKFKDYGDRDVALRYDQTVPTCRFVAQHQHELPMPWKRYQIQTVWRADKPQKGRYREFLQCDIDIFGLQDAIADAETIALTIESYRNLGFEKFKVRMSDRALYSGIDYPVIVAIDKLHKIGTVGVHDEIVSKGYSEAEATAIMDRIFSLKPNQTILQIFDYLKSSGFSDDYYMFDNTMARSFSYSTGPIWEVEIEGFEGGSVGGGERYDQLVGRFSKNDIPGTGIAFGFDRTLEAMQQFDLLPQKSTITDLLVTIFDQKYLADSIKLAQQLRKQGLNVDLYTDPAAKLGKQFKYADHKQIPFAAVYGPDEIKAGKVSLKDMRSGEQMMVDISDIKSVITTI